MATQARPGEAGRGQAWRGNSIKRRCFIIKNEDLKKIYDDNTLNWHSGFAESIMLVNMMDSWAGLSVLEIGCGDGNLCSILRYAGANVAGMDYSPQQVLRAEKKYPSIPFMVGDIAELEYSYDVIVMQGVLEHLDKPWDMLKLVMDHCKVCCLSVPAWENPRGYVYHTLRLLCGAKMSLTDLHFFLREDFVKFANENSLKIKLFTAEKDWACGSEMISDFRDRIPKAFPAVTDNVEPFLDYLSRLTKYVTTTCGAVLGIKLKKS